MSDTLDAVASSIAGEDLESLAEVDHRQRFVADGPVTSDRALALLRDVGSAKRVPRSRRSGRAATELLTAGLIDDRARPTPFGRRLQSHWTDSTPLLEITARGAAVGTASAWLGASSVLIAATPPPRELTGAPPDPEARQIGLRTPDHALPALAAWIGIRPAWTFGDGPWEVPLDMYEDRLEDVSVAPPADAGPAAQSAWSAPWTEFVVRSRAGVLRFVALDGGGFLSVVTSSSAARVDTLAPFLLFTNIVDLYGRAIELTARTPT